MRNEFDRPLAERASEEGIFDALERRERIIP
jgi:hypothetical protein